MRLSQGAFFSAAWRLTSCRDFSLALRGQATARLIAMLASSVIANILYVATLSFF